MATKPVKVRNHTKHITVTQNNTKVGTKAATRKPDHSTRVDLMPIITKVKISKPEVIMETTKVTVTTKVMESQLLNLATSLTRVGKYLSQEASP